MFLRQVGQIPRGLVYSDPEAVVKLVTPRQPTAFIRNDSVLVLGEAMLVGFDRLEVLNSTANATLQAMQLGPLAKMPEDVIRDLESAFGR